MRYSLRFVPDKDRNAVERELKKIYTAPRRDDAKGTFVSDQALLKLLYLACKNISKKWLITSQI